MKQSENGSSPATVLEPPASLPVLGDYEVVVCGGGPAGCSAALAAARNGARTLLIEKDGYLGGATVSQLVAVVLSTNGADLQGVWHEYIRNLARFDGVRGPFRRAGHSEIWGTVDPECVKRIWDAMLTEAGVTLLHHAYASDAIQENGAVRGVVVETIAGRQAVWANRVIDATANGVVCAAAGVPWSQGDGRNPWAMALTKVFRMGNVNWPACRIDDEAMAKLEANLDEAIGRGDYVTPVMTTKKRLLNYVRGKAWRLPEKRHESLSVISRVLRIDPLDPDELTRAEREGRAQAWEAADFLRRYASGFERAYLLDTSEHIGVRSSRRIQGLCTVTEADVLEFRKYEDGIARSSWNIDIWPADSYTAPAVDRESAAAIDRRTKLNAGDWFDIRYGCLVAIGVDGLLMAGRCISASHLAESSLRIQQTCMATGQAAGTAAALSLKLGTTPRELDISVLVSKLKADRAATVPYPIEDEQ